MKMSRKFPNISTAPAVLVLMKFLFTDKVWHILNGQKNRVIME